MLRWPLGLIRCTVRRARGSDGAFSSAFLVARHGHQDVILTTACSYIFTVAIAGFDAVSYDHKPGDYMDSCFWRWGLWASSSRTARCIRPPCGFDYDPHQPLGRIVQ